MNTLKELEIKKRSELYGGLTCLGFTFEEARNIFERMEDECLVEVIPPQAEEIPMQWVHLHAGPTGRYSGNSYKPGNIIFNVKDAVLNSLSAIISAAASMAAFSMDEPLIGGLTVFSAFLSIATLGKASMNNELSLVLAVLWENRHVYGNSIERKDGLRLANDKLSTYGRENLSDVQYNDLLSDLDHMKCIELVNDRIILREKVCISY